MNGKSKKENTRRTQHEKISIPAFEPLPAAGRAAHAGAGFAGSIFPSEGAVKTVTLDDGSLSLQNEYIYMTFRKLWGTYAYLTVAPAAKPDEEGVLIGQTPRCTFITYDQGREKKEGVVTEPIKAEFVTKTPNGARMPSRWSIRC